MAWGRFFKNLSQAAINIAFLTADRRFAPLPIAASRTVALGGTVATVGFPNIGLQGFAPKLAKGEIASLSGAGDDPRYFQISVPVQPGNSGGALVDGLLEQAAARGLIELPPALARLRQTNARLDPELIRTALARDQARKQSQ